MNIRLRPLQERDPPIFSRLQSPIGKQALALKEATQKAMEAGRNFLMLPLPNL
jgi:hypothetical protein